MSEESKGSTAQEPIKATSKAQAVRDYLTKHPRAKNAQVVKALKTQGIETNPGYVSRIKTQSKKSRSKKKKKPGKAPRTASAKYPRHSLRKVLRTPKAIIEQNAGRDCSESEAAEFVGVGLAGPFKVEIRSAIKFGLLERPKS